MGNRAMVVFENKDGTKRSPMAYLHWNGGPESIYAFLNEMDRRGIRCDQDYEMARFIHIVCDFFDNSDTGAGGLSVGVHPIPHKKMDAEDINWGAIDEDHGLDNGVYLVCRCTREIRMRRFTDKEFTPQQVEEERKLALQDNYIVALENRFKEMRPIISKTDGVIDRTVSDKEWKCPE